MKKAKVELPDLTEFDYRNLNGQSFLNYQQIALNLPADNEFVYEQYSAFGEFKFRINENTGDKEEYLFGIKLKSSDPINVTQIPAKMARELNEQIMAKHPVSNSRYYLLKK